MLDISSDIEEYWTNRAEGYSDFNKKELSTMQKNKWIHEIENELKEINKPKELINILDIGCGPGFFSIILARAGYKVTAIDYTNKMLEKAKENCGDLLSKINFIKMDAQNLQFNDESFDVVVSRNLTWNLEKPFTAYEEWISVLKKKGILLNFDANWYHHLFDDEKKKAYENDRKTVANSNLEDHYTCTDIGSMEEIARKVPLSKIMRPDWDISIFNDIGVTSINVDLEVWKRLWSEEEKVNYASTPMFLIKVIK